MAAASGSGVSTETQKNISLKLVTIWCLTTLAKISAVWQHGLLFNQHSNVGVRTWFAEQCHYHDVLLLSGRACTAKAESGRTWVTPRNRNKW